MLQPPTIGRRYDDAWIADGVIYSGYDFEVVGQDKRALIAKGQVTELHDRMLATGYVSEKFFGHWLLDGQSHELLAQQTGIAGIGIQREPWLQEPGYRACTGLQLEQIRLAHFKNLWLVDDRSINANRRARMVELRRRVRSVAASEMAHAPVFLRRVGGARRPLLNQEELANSLARRGFLIITPEEESVPTLIAALQGANLVVSVEGSALCHGVLSMIDGGTIVAIQPPTRVDWIQKVWTDAADLRFAMTIASPSGDGFTMDENRLLRLLDLVAREQ